MIYFKKLKEDGNLERIGTSDILIEGIEITESEYQTLLEDIRSKAIEDYMEDTSTEM